MKELNIDPIVNSKPQIEMGVEVRSRQYYASFHIRAAALFSRLAFDIEENNKFNGIGFLEHRAYVTNTVFSATAFLEAYINELFSDISDKEVRKYDPKYKALESKFNIFSELWEAGIPRTSKYSILDKYQIALAIAEKEKFTKGSKLYQDIDILIKLRNALIHYEPEWILDDYNNKNNSEHKMTKLLKPRIKKLNPFDRGQNPFYPNKCMGHGLAEWTVESSIKFVDEFSDKIEIIGSYNDCRQSLNTK